ncbi:MAG: metal-binding protein [Thermostichales cyanobacterium DRC_bins_46]
MPLGKVHDRITLCTLPLVTLLAGLVGGAAMALAVGGGYLFAGLMFAGDLDTYSRQYRRWLWLRWIWIPYQKLCRHRSFWSHGPIVGTLGRLLYLGIWLLGIPGLVWGVGYWWGWWGPGGGGGWDWLVAQRWHGVGIGLGLELGSLSHSLSDQLGSAWKGWRKGRQRF